MIPEIVAFARQSRPRWRPIESPAVLQLSPPPEQSYRTKSELVYSTLRRAIMRCELGPGTRLIIDDISEALGVSHIPVREALNLLQSEGLVTVVPHSGATVAPVSPGDVTEIFSIMEGLEIVATRVAAERASPEQLDLLAAMLPQLDAAVTAQEPEAWAELNIAFHREIAAITGMPMLNEMMNRVLDRWDRVRRFVKVLPERMSEAQQQHHDIVRALQRHDIATAQALATLHNRGALGAYQSRFDANRQA
jgi:DNA-binding GntR family transcriptional regulator